MHSVTKPLTMPSVQVNVAAFMAEDPAPPDWLQALVGEGHLSIESAEQARQLARQTNTPVSAVLTRLGMLSEQALAAALSRMLDLTLLEREQLQADSAMPPELNRDFCQARHLLPLQHHEGTVLRVAMANPTDSPALQGVAFAYDQAVEAVVALESDIDDAWRSLTVAREPAPDVLPDTYDLSDEATLLADHASDAPVIRLVSRVIGKAISLGASDIHFEPAQDALNLRYRVDGELGASEALARHWCEPVASRLKLMAKLDIAETRYPQDGRLRTSVQGHAIDLRLATFPTLHGESVVLRVLGQQNVVLDLDRIGLSDQGLAALREALARPHGLVLITGPTGSGKTTTLYAALKALRRPQIKLVTVEDPIEYTLPGVSQLQVKPDIGLGYPEALRSVLRNDPDIIMIGEIRDRDTADIAIRAALTGHLVLATLHTNSAAGAVTRLLDLGVQDYLLASTLALTSAQRLVRRLCRKCAQSRPARPDECSLLRKSGLLSQTAPAPRLHEAIGCGACQGRGYSGRVPLYEAILLTDQLSSLLQDGFDEAAFNRAAIANGAKSLFEHGLAQVLRGETTLAEVLAVTGVALVPGPGAMDSA